jgi:hypothetical protein
MDRRVRGDGYSAPSRRSGFTPAGHLPVCPTAPGASGAAVKEVRIHRLADEVFYASTVIAAGSNLMTVDARPSDALNLALLSDSRILVSADVLVGSLTCEATDAAEVPDADASQLVAAARARFRHEPRVATP